MENKFKQIAADLKAVAVAAKIRSMAAESTDGTLTDLQHEEVCEYTVELAAEAIIETASEMQSLSCAELRDLSESLYRAFQAAETLKRLAE